uniref:Uncharacterized protein n=1 Tax=Anguilla anguilla TaxID=7936 RepID=A0A0E9PCM9_ANGAN
MAGRSFHLAEVCGESKPTFALRQHNTAQAGGGRYSRGGQQTTEMIVCLLVTDGES